MFSVHAGEYFDHDDSHLVDAAMSLVHIIYIISIVLYATWLLTALLMPCAMKKVPWASMSATIKSICRSALLAYRSVRQRFYWQCGIPPSALTGRHV